MVVRELANVMQEYTQSGYAVRLRSARARARASMRVSVLMSDERRRGVRPFGVSLLVAGADALGNHLFQVDPSGSYWAWKASAIGKQMVTAKTFLEKRYNETMELEDAVHTAILTLKEGFEGQLDENSLEIGLVKNGVFLTLSVSDVKDYLGEVQ
jgi:20S proteasome subunit alpha 2